jgi:hypothetical protein
MTAPEFISPATVQPTDKRWHFRQSLASKSIREWGFSFPF